MIFIMEIPQNCTCSCHDSVVDFYRILFDSKKQFPGLEIKTLPLYKSQRQSIITIKLLCKKKALLGHVKSVSRIEFLHRPIKCNQKVCRTLLSCSRWSCLDKDKALNHLKIDTVSLRCRRLPFQLANVYLLPPVQKSLMGLKVNFSIQSLQPFT
jgi:hypothetical protein